MMLLLRLAWRNLWRNRRRTKLTMTVMIIAVSLLIFTLAMYDGMLWDMVENVTEVMTGHIVIAERGSIERPNLHASIEDDPALIGRLKVEPWVRGVCPRVSAFALLSCGPEHSAKTHPGQLLGIDPEVEEKTSRLARGIISGRFIKNSSDSEVVLGAGLARRLSAEPGAELIVIGQGSDGSMVTEILKIVGVIDTGDQLRDSTIAIMKRSAMQNMFGLTGRIHTLHVFIDSPMSAREAASALQVRAFGEKAAAVSWQEIHPQISQVFSVWAAMQIFTMLIFYFGVVLITFSTMYMAFIERFREFGMLRAIGLTPLRLFSMIIIEGFIMSLLSGVVGTALGCLMGWWISVWPIDLSAWLPGISYGGTSILPRIRGVLTIFNILMPCIVMITLGALISLLPAWRMFSLRPVEALREG